jgi:hypothetical protein
MNFFKKYLILFSGIIFFLTVAALIVVSVLLKKQIETNSLLTQKVDSLAKVDYDQKRLIDNTELLIVKIINTKDSTINILNENIIFNRNLYKFNWENVCFWVDYYNIKNPDIVKSQILLETDFLTSNICIYNHNLFGMKHPRAKGRKSLGTFRGHAVYNSYIESIEDYKIWQDRYYKYDKLDYYTFLKKVGYAEDRRYINKLKMIEKTYIKEKKRID